MATDKLQRAKDLIQVKRYDEARAVLKTVDHPTAQKWLQKLDEIAPARQTKRQAPSWINYLVVGVACGLVGLLIGVVVGRSSAPAPEMTPAAVAVAPTVETAVPTRTLPPTWTLTPAATSTPECSAQAWWNNVESVVVQYLDTAETATQTARISLSGVVLQLQQNYREFERIDYPDCMQDLHLKLARGMELGIAGFNDFMGQADILSAADFELATIYFWVVYTRLLKDYVVITDTRMADMAVLVWGGDSPNEATATAFANLGKGNP